MFQAGVSHIYSRSDEIRDITMRLQGEDEMYETFARVYDTFMDEVPYDAWADCLIREMRKTGSKTAWYLILAAEPGR